MGNTSKIIISLLIILSTIVGFVIGNEMCKGTTYNEKALVKESIK